MRITFLWMLAIGFVLASARVSIAQRNYGNGVYGGRNRNNNSGAMQQPEPPAPPPASPAPPPASQPSAPPSQLSIDEAALRAAALDLAKAQGAQQVIVDADWQKYEQTPEWTDLQTKLTSAQGELDSAKQASKDALANNTDYQDALAAKKKASDALDAAKAQDETDPATLGPLAEANLQATLALRKMESEVQQNDTGVQSATEKLELAQHDVDMAKRRFEQGLSADKDYGAATAAVAAAQQRYDALRQKVMRDNSSEGDN
jgi:hypothetical protein